MWYDTCQQITATWTDIKRHLTLQFRKSVPFCKLFKEAALCDAKLGQSLGDYCFDKLNKLRKLGLAIPTNTFVKNKHVYTYIFLMV